MNAFSAVCGALSIWLLYDLMRVGAPVWMDTYQYDEKRRQRAGILAGLVAAVSLAFCVPFWSVSNRAHMASFEVFLLLVAARLLLASITSGRFLYLAVLTVLYGFMAAEFATMLVMAPLFALGGLYALWRQEQLQPRRISLLCGLLAAGLLIGYSLGALGFYGTAGYELRDYDGFWHLLWRIWRDQGQLLSRSLPREGWLIILFTTTVPWLAMFAVARRGLNDDRDWGLVLLHLIMTVFAVSIWVNVPLSPWRMLGWRRLLVTPYVLTAIVTGYLATFWYLVSGLWSDSRESGWFAVLRFGMARLVSLGLLLLAVLVPWWNGPEASVQGMRNLDVVVDAVLDSLDGRAWLISDGQLDTHIHIRAWQRDMPLQVISLSAGGQSLYQRYIASLFEDVRLQNAARLSLSALFQEWLSDPDDARTVAVLVDADLWRRLGYEPVPNGMVYKGIKADSLENVERIVEQQLPFMDRFESRLGPEEDEDTLAGQLGTWGRRHAGRLANDAAVLMEDHGHHEQARQLYDRARQMDPENVSALLNLSAMVEAGRIEDSDGSIARDLAELEASLTERFRIWSLSRAYGVVRAPEAFAQMGWTWAYSGQPGLAVAQVERAAALAGDIRSPAMDALMAEVYLLDNRPLESKVIYQGMLADEDRRLAGLMGLYRLAVRERDWEQARERLGQAELSGMEPDQVKLEQAMLDLMEGRAKDAVSRLEPLLMDRRDLLRGWVLLAEAGTALEEERLVNRALRRIEILEGARGYYTSLLRARQAFGLHDYAQAAEHFETALSRRPGHMPLTEELLRLNLLLQRREPAERYMRMILQQNPDHALALYVRGSLQMAAGEYRLAEDSLRRSLRNARLPMALNDLSWLLMQRESFEEAEALAREALAANSDQPAVWDTLGVIYLRTGRLELAEEALSRSLALNSDAVIVHLHMGQLQLQLGRTQAVREIVERFEPHRDRLREEERRIWQQLREAIR